MMADFQLQTSVIIQMLGEPEFYNSCVSYLFMRDQGVAAVAQYNKAVAEKEAGCDGCNQKHKNEKDYVVGPIATFVSIIRELHAIDPGHLKPVRDFISTKLGYQPDAIVLHYKKSGTKQTLKF